MSDKLKRYRFDDRRATSEHPDADGWRYLGDWGHGIKDGWYRRAHDAWASRPLSRRSSKSLAKTCKSGSHSPVALGNPGSSFLKKCLTPCRQYALRPLGAGRGRQIAVVVVSCCRCRPRAKRSLGLAKYEAIFRDNDIDETVLPSLTHENLKELGVASFGHRVKLLDAIAALRSAWILEPSATGL